MGTRNPDTRNQNKGQPAPVTKINSRPPKTQTSVSSPNTTIPDEKDNTITLVETNHDANGDGKEKQQSERNENINVAHKMRKRIRKNTEITTATVNVRGLKGKIRSLESLLQTEKITIALITETMMKKGDQISIKGYRWIDKPKENNKGGRVGILVSEKIAQNTTEDNFNDEYENLETKWIQIESRPRNLAIGVFYGPQENDCAAKVKEIYAALNNQLTHKAENNEIILAGDFNAKIAISTKNCKQRESRNGKLLQKIITDNNMTVANLKADAGIWTRVNRKKSEEKSVIDYILASPYIAKGIQTLIVDEEGHLRVKGKNETDHNTITMTIKINDPRKPKFQERWRLNNKEGWKLFNKTIQLEENKSIIMKGTYKQAGKNQRKYSKTQ